MIELANPLSDSIVAEFDHLRIDCAWVDLAHYSFITLRGDDRKGWLQGQATNNLRSLDQGASSSFCVCEPTGHMLTLCDIWSADETFYVSFPAATRDRFLQRIEQMVILEDVHVEDASVEFRVLSLQGPRATSELSQTLTLPSLDAGLTTLNDIPVVCLRSNRAGMGGWDLWIPAKETEAIKFLLDLFPTVSPEPFEIARIEAGVPRFGQDCDAKTFPPELGSAFESRYISYNKGCYTGQEVLMRLHSRGHTNRTWVGLVSESPLEVGAVLTHPNRKDAGLVTSAAFSPDYGFIGAAMVRNEIAQPRESVMFETSAGSFEAQIRPMPILRFD